MTKSRRFDTNPDLTVPGRRNLNSIPQLESFLWLHQNGGPCHVDFIRFCCRPAR